MTRSRRRDAEVNSHLGAALKPPSLLLVTRRLTVGRRDGRPREPAHRTVATIRGGRTRERRGNVGGKEETGNATMTTACVWHLREIRQHEKMSSFAHAKNPILSFDICIFEN